MKLCVGYIHDEPDASLVDTLPELWNMQIKGSGMMQMLSSRHFGSSPCLRENQSTIEM